MSRNNAAVLAERARRAARQRELETITIALVDENGNVVGYGHQGRGAVREAVMRGQELHELHTGAVPEPLQKLNPAHVKRTPDEIAPLRVRKPKPDAQPHDKKDKP